MGRCLAGCSAPPYTPIMITTFKHKGLRDFFLTRTTRGIQAEHAARLIRILGALDVAVKPSDMDIPGYRLHQLKGNLASFWSVTVSGNWRVIFQFNGSDVELLDYCDYH